MPDKIAVVGLGQIGGSLVLSLRKNGFQGSIFGIDPSPQKRKLLRHHLDSIANRFDPTANVDLIFLCVHYSETIAFLDLFGSTHKGLLFDCCSGKEKICKFAQGRKIRFIGGHPMAGNEKSGEKGWDADLFQSKPFFLCPIRSTRSSDLARIKNIIRMIGANPVTIDPRLHDFYVAQTSHFPAFLSIMLRDATPDVPDDFQGSGYASMTRLSQTPAELQRTFLESNGKNVIRAANRFRKILDAWIQAKKDSIE